MLDGGELIPGREVALPGNATPLERALAAIDGRLLDLPADLIRAVKDPLTCPAHLLGHLAWERSVDVWDPSWPDDMKRRVIAASYIVHRFKGTRYAVETALGALGFKTSLTEWWQTTPMGEPYTFKVRAFALERLVPGQPVITEPMTRAVIASVIAAKPVSRTMSFEIAAGVQSKLGIAACGRALQVGTPIVVASPPKQLASGLIIGSRARALQVDIASVSASPVKFPAARVMMAARVRGLQIFTARMEATLQ